MPKTRQDAWQALCAAKPPSWVLGHCRCVEALAVAMCRCAERNGLVVDEKRVQAAALMHDIGRSVTQDIHHARVGADLVRAAGWDESVVLMVERHTGGGIDEADARDLGLPVRDYTPRTLEERIVCHADNLYSGDKRLTLLALQEKYEAKHLPAAWAKISRLHAQLCAQLGTDLEKLAPVELPLA